jgi:hypothetical protein
VLTTEERTEVEAALVVAFATHSQPRQLVPVIFTSEDDHGAILIRTGSSDPPVLARHTLEVCLRSRWTRDPSLLESLLEYLVTSKGIGRFDPILIRVRQRIDPNPSLYESSWLLSDSRPFFDRHELRGHVRLLIEQDGWPILRVCADNESFGRSYTSRFFQHLERRSPTSLHVLTAAISRGAGPSYQVEDLLDELGSQLRNSEPVPERTGSFYPTQAARWLLRQMNRNDGFWLVVLDGFGQRPINEEVQLTVEDLASRVPVGQHRQRIRLVLLDYSHSLPNVDPADILEETLLPAANICIADLLPCLQTWDVLRRKKGLKGVAPDTLTALAQEIIGQAPVAGKARLETLNARLIDLLKIP